MRGLVPLIWCSTVNTEHSEKASSFELYNTALVVVTCNHKMEIYFFEVFCVNQLIY